MNLTIPSVVRAVKEVWSGTKLSLRQQWIQTPVAKGRLYLALWDESSHVLSRADAIELSRIIIMLVIADLRQLDHFAACVEASV